MHAPQLNDQFIHEFIFSEEQLLTYASISGDTNPIHVSNDFGNKSIFGKCIVHGYFSISVFSKVYGTLLYPDEHILINQSAKYIRPIYTGINYIAEFIVIGIDPIKNRVTYKNEIFDAKTHELKVTGEATLMNKKHYKW